MVKIPLNISDAYANQHYKDDFSKLVDGNPNTIYTVWNPPTQPYIITFDFFSAETCVIKQIKFLINNGNPSKLKFFIEKKDTKEKVLLYAYTGGVWIPTMRTYDVPVQVNASKFIIENEGGNDFPADFELWGDYVEKTQPLPVLQHSPLSELMGANVKAWDVNFKMYPEKKNVFLSVGLKRVRFYNDYETNHNADGTWNMNEFGQVDSMKELKANGVQVQMCYLSLPTNYPWPVTDRDNVESYLKLAQDVYQFGKHSKDNGNYFDVFELTNEPDAWYMPENYHMNGYQLAAMFSMGYDGHKGKYPNAGLKASGCTAMFSSGGVAEGEAFLLYQMIEWSIKNRGYRSDGSVDLPFDIYSFHCYSSLEGQRQGIPGGIPPELGAAPYFQKINTVRKRYIPKTRIHVGEWAWDVSATSPLNAPAFGSYSAHQVSAMWTVRELCLMAENEINASSYYRIVQDYPDASYDNSPRQFDTMALVRQENLGDKQPDGTYGNLGMHRVLTGDYVKQLSEFFNDGYVFDSRVSTSPNVLKFKRGTTEMYVIWETETMAVTDKPAFTEKTGTYNLNVKGKIRRFVDDMSGVMTSADFGGGAIQYSSKPVIVIADGSVTPPIPPVEPDKPAPKIQVDRGYFINAAGKKIYWVMYNDNTWVQADSKYKPLLPK
jgi:hypothetical protein